MKATSPDPERTTRITYPTASFSLTVSQIAWIAKEAKRRAVSKSVLVRELLDAAMDDERKDRAA